MTACAREGCGHATEAHFGGSRCRVEGWGVNAGSTDFGRCSCPAYKPAPTPTADVRCTCPGGEQFHSRTNERCPRSMIASFREAWPDPDSAPSLGERDDAPCSLDGVVLCPYVERARTAEVERLRDLTPHQIYAENVKNWQRTISQTEDERDDLRAQVAAVRAIAADALEQWSFLSYSVHSDRCSHRGGIEVCDPDYTAARAAFDALDTPEATP